MNMVTLFVPIAGMVMIVAMTALVARLVASVSLNRTIREALRSDPGSVPLLADRLGRYPPWGDALLGVIFLALAAAMILLGLTEEDQDESYEILRGAILPAVVGVTVLLYTRFAARRAVSGVRADIDEGPRA